MSKTYSGLGVVQPDTARQSPLGQKAQLRDDGLVDLFGRVPIVLVASPELVLRLVLVQASLRERLGARQGETQAEGPCQCSLTSFGTRCIVAHCGFTGLGSPVGGVTPSCVISCVSAGVADQES